MICLEENNTNFQILSSPLLSSDIIVICEKFHFYVVLQYTVYFLKKEVEMHYRVKESWAQWTIFLRNHGKVSQPHNAGLFIHPFWSQKKVHSILCPSAGLVLTQVSVTTTSAESLTCSLCGKVLSPEASTTLVFHATLCSTNSQHTTVHRLPACRCVCHLHMLFAGAGVYDLLLCSRLALCRRISRHGLHSFLYYLLTLNLGKSCSLGSTSVIWGNKTIYITSPERVC